MADKLKKIRTQAEEFLKLHKNEINIDEYKNNIQLLTEEFSISQIELEMQNKELREKEYELQLEKQRYADLFYNAPNGYLIFDQSGVIVDLNAKADRILASAKSSRSKPFLIFLKKDQADIFFSHLEDVYNNEKKSKNIIEVELIIQDKEGQTKYVNLKSNIYDDKFCRTSITDITKEKLNWQKIQQLNQRLEASMSAGNMAWWEVNLPSGLLVFNENKAQMLGRDPKNFKHYMDFMNLVHPDDYENTMEAFRQHLYKGKEVYECEYRIKTIEGNYLWFHDIGKIVEKKDGNIKLTGIVSNITAEKQAELSLKKVNTELNSTIEELNSTIEILDSKNLIIKTERKQFLSLLDSIPQPIYVADINTYEILFANETLKKNFPQFSLGQKCYSLLQGKENVCEFCTNNTLLSNNKTHFWEYYNTKLNKHFYVMDKIIKWTDGQDVRFELATDISKIKEYEMKLKGSEQKMLTILKTLPELLFHFDKTGKYLSFYQESNNLVKQPVEFLGKTVLEIFDKEFANEIMHSIKQTLINGSFEHNYSLQLDKKRFFQAKYSKLNDSEVIALVSDITGRIESEKIIAKQNKELKLSNATKDKFFRIIGHDLKAPFNSILGFSDLLVKNIEKYDKTKIKKFVENINSSSKTIYKLVNDLLEWARAQQGKTPFAPSKLNLKEIVDEVFSYLSHQASLKEVNLIYDIPDHLSLIADSEMLKTIIRNLVSNSIKYTPTGGYITLNTQQEDSKTIVAISDTGIGMTEETKNALFYIGETKSIEGTNGEIGTGFGLMITYEFIKKHNGTISVDSEINKGSTFTISLPNS